MTLKRLLLLAAIAAPLIYAHREKPSLDEHKEAIWSRAKGTETVDEAVYELPQWEAMGLSDWVFLTATKDREKQSLISFGLAGYIKVVDTEWGPKTFGMKSVER